MSDDTLYITFVDASTISGIKKDALRKRIASAGMADKLVKQGRAGYLDITLYRELMTHEAKAGDPETSDVQLYRRDRAGVLVPAPARHANVALETEAEHVAQAELLPPEPIAVESTDDPAVDTASTLAEASDQPSSDPDAATAVAIVAEQAAEDDDDEASIDPSELEDITLPGDDDLDALIDDADERDHDAYQDDTLTISTVSVDVDPDTTTAMPAVEGDTLDTDPETDPEREAEPEAADDDETRSDEQSSEPAATSQRIPVAVAGEEVSDELAHARACRQVIHAAIPNHDELDRYLGYLKAPQRTWFRRWITKTEQPPPSWWRKR